jgi:hypothetical protein
LANLKAELSVARVCFEKGALLLLQSTQGTYRVSVKRHPSASAHDAAEGFAEGLRLLDHPGEQMSLHRSPLLAPLPLCVCASDERQLTAATRKEVAGSPREMIQPHLRSCLSDPGAELGAWLGRQLQLVGWSVGAPCCRCSGSSNHSAQAATRSRYRHRPASLRVSVWLLGA